MKTIHNDLATATSEALRYKELVARLRKTVADNDATIKHLRKKAEFDMPPEMIGKHHNACNEPCDMIHGPCACGAWHNAKEWIIKLQAKLNLMVNRKE